MLRSWQKNRLRDSYCFFFSFFYKISFFYTRHPVELYRVAHEKPARRLVEQRGRSSRDSVQEIKQIQMQSIYWLEKVLKMISL